MKNFKEIATEFVTKYPAMFDTDKWFWINQLEMLLETNSAKEISPETFKMLYKLQTSANESCAQTAKRILSGQTTIETELKYSGGFMSSVLKGETDLAFAKADIGNHYALSKRLEDLP